MSSRSSRKHTQRPPKRDPDGWGPWEWDFESGRWKRTREREDGTIVYQFGESAAKSQPRTSPTPNVQQDDSSPVDSREIDYKTGDNYRVAQGFEAETDQNTSMQDLQTYAASESTDQGSFQSISTTGNQWSPPGHESLSTSLSSFSSSSMGGLHASSGFHNYGSDATLMSRPGFSASYSYQTPLSNIYTPGISPQAQSTPSWQDPHIASPETNFLDSATYGDQSVDEIAQDFESTSLEDQAESRPRARSRSIHALTNPEIQRGISIRGPPPVTEDSECEDELDVETNLPEYEGQPDDKQELPPSKSYITIKTNDPKTKKDPLYKEYRVQKSAEFKKGRIFKILWSEPLGTANTGGDRGTDGTEVLYVEDAKYGQRVYSTIRRFVIVKAKKGHCVCVPILTYSNQGTAKPGVKPDDHAIIYTSSRGPPNELPGEQKLLKKPIRVVPDNQREKLRPESRVNYSKVYTVEHNVKVCFVGKIALDHEAAFFADFKRTFWEDQ